jgi:hypothetical protein
MYNRAQRVFSENESAVGATVSTVLTVVSYKYYWYCTPTPFCSVSGGWMSPPRQHRTRYTDVQQLVLEQRRVRGVSMGESGERV